MKHVVIVLSVLFPLSALAVPPSAPILLAPEVKSSTHIRWHFRNSDPSAVSYELRDELGRRTLQRVDNPRATYIDETNVIPADPDMACARYVVAINKNGEQSFGQKLTYPCVRTPPVIVPQPTAEIVDMHVLKITLTHGANDPAVGLGVYEAERGAWVSPEHLFTATPTFLTIGAWNAVNGVLLIGLRPHTSYTFYAQARSVTGERSKFSAATRVRMPAEPAQPGAPTLDRLGELSNLRTQTLSQTFQIRQTRPVIAGLVAAGALVTIDIDDRPYVATVAPPRGGVSSFDFESPKLSTGLHTLRLGAIHNGTAAWTPTIEFRVK